MYTTDGRKMTWKEFENRRENGENIFVGEYPKEDVKAFLEYAHTHTKKQVEKYLEDTQASLDIMYVNGRPKYYDEWSGECAGVRCLDGILWN